MQNKKLISKYVYMSIIIEYVNVQTKLFAYDLRQH